MLWSRKSRGTSMIRSAIVALFLPLFAGHAFADPQADAEYIVDVTITPELFEATMAGVADLMVGNLQNEYAKVGQPISNDAARVISDMLSDQIVTLMTRDMRSQMVAIHVAGLSPEVLADYRAFLETPSGQKLISATPLLTMESQKIGEEIGGRIASEAFANIRQIIAEEEWPARTLPSTQAEIRAAFAE
ncbi:MAG: DUF2059 domain-containing protein [Pseudomonadota bacterium]